MNKTYLSAWCALVILFVFSFPAHANKAAVSLEAPEKATKGTPVTIKVKVSHNGNNFFHHTNWVSVKVNGKEVGRWEFTRSSLPENEIFSEEVTVTPEDALVIEAEANCNIHGSAGPATRKVDLQGE